MGDSGAELGESRARAQTYTWGGARTQARTTHYDSTRAGLFLVLHRITAAAAVAVELNNTATH